MNEPTNAEAADLLDWAGSIFRKTGEAHARFTGLSERLRAPGATFSAEEGADVSHAEVAEALDHPWPAPSDLADAVAEMAGRLRTAPAPTP